MSSNFDLYVRVASAKPTSLEQGTDSDETNNKISEVVDEVKVEGDRSNAPTKTN